jgi:glycosyltransferase involved in cell wall biosynthesis
LKLGIDFPLPPGCTPVSDAPLVLILLATYNGERFLSEQLHSIEAQTYKNWALYVSDDQSQDGTTDKLLEFQSRHPDRCTIRQHTRGNSFAQNFMSMVFRCPVEADYYAFCDQDDIWASEKLERALTALKTIPSGKPVLYCGRTKLVNAENQPIGYSPKHKKAPSFKNALTQNIGGGNTMVFNKSTVDILRKVTDQNSTIAHDWWTYLTVTAVGGSVIYDPIPYVRYRQHKDNAIGHRVSNAKRLARIINGAVKEVNDRNSSALMSVQPYMSSENRDLFENYLSARRKTGLVKWKLLTSLRLYRQSRIGNIALGAAILMNKF